MREIGPRWIGSVTTIERAFPIERPSAPQPFSTAQPRLSKENAHVGTRVPIGRNAEAHGEAGMESEEGTAFESLPRRKPCRNTADQPFLLQSTLNRSSCFAGASSVCSFEPKRKLFAKLDRSSRWSAADGSSGVLNDSGFSTSFDRRIEEALPRRS
jgi:hypothetical protein